jgi:hypothetical protein
MTKPGSRKHDATGRSTDRLKQHQHGRIEGPFVQLTKEMLESPAWGALTLADRKVIDRLVIEHMAHAGTENGNLICTWSDFEASGIRRKSIATATSRVVALGFAERVRQGGKAWGDVRLPSIYRLTFVTGNLAPTNEWQGIKTPEGAAAIAGKAARSNRNKKPGAKSPPMPGAQTPPLGTIPGGANATPVPGAKVPPLSISRGSSRGSWEAREPGDFGNQSSSASHPKTLNGSALPTNVITINPNRAQGGQSNGFKSK